MVSLSATYDPSTDVGAVRLLLFDVDMTTVPTSTTAPPRKTWTVIFADEEIESVLSRYMGHCEPPVPIYYSAAELLDATANNKAFLEKRIKIGDYEKDTKTTAKSLHDQASRMREYADLFPVEFITDIAWSDPNYARILYDFWIAGS